MIKKSPEITCKSGLLLAITMKLSVIIKSINRINGEKMGLEALHTIENDPKSRAIFPINRTKPAKWRKNGPDNSKGVSNSWHSTNVKESGE
jgi:hypothetical protein